MNTYRVFLTATVVCALGWPASGQTFWTVREHGGSMGGDCGCYTVSQAAKEIVIVQDPGRRLQFEVFYADSGGNYLVPAEINDFTIAPGLNVDLDISIMGDEQAEPPRVFGATDIAKMNLVQANPSQDLTIVKKIRISGDMATGPEGVFIDLMDGWIGIDGDLIADVSVRGVLATDEFSFLVGGDLVGSLTFMGHANRPINIYGDLIGTLDIQGNLMKRLRIGDPIAPFGGGNLSGTVTIAGNVDAGDIENAGQIEVSQQLSGMIAIGGDVQNGINNWVRIRQMTGGSFACRDLALRADDGGHWFVTGYGSPFDPTLIHSGTIMVNGELSGRVYCRGLNDLAITVNTINAASEGSKNGYGGIMTAVGFKPNASITVAGDFTMGAIKYPGGVHATSLPMDVPITIGGDMGSATTTARISSEATINGNPANFDIGGVIHIARDLYGTVSGDGPAIFAEGNLTGQVRIDGSLFDGLGGDEIVIAGSPFGAQGAVVVDYNGYDEIDVWGAGATVKVGSAPAYTGNTPSAKVWESSSVLGDMNNDGALNGGDIDPFFALLGGGPSCRGFNFMTPENIAWLIETNVRPDRLERAILLVAEYVNVWATGQRRTFWTEVLELLRPS